MEACSLRRSTMSATLLRHHGLHSRVACSQGKISDVLHLRPILRSRVLGKGSDFSCRAAQGPDDSQAGKLPRRVGGKGGRRRSRNTRKEEKDKPRQPLLAEQKTAEELLARIQETLADFGVDGAALSVLGPPPAWKGTMTFAAVDAAEEGMFFYIRPADLDDTVLKLVTGQYLTLISERQAGKTTTVAALMKELSTRTVALEKFSGQRIRAIKITFGNRTPFSKGPAGFWAWVLGELATSEPRLFGGASERFRHSSQGFREALQKPGAPPCVLFFDETSRLAGEDAELVDDFLDTMRTLRNTRAAHCVHAVMLVGVDSINAMLDEHNQSRRGSVNSEGGGQLDTSPFTEQASLRVSRFSTEDVCMLLRQYKDYEEQYSQTDMGAFELEPIAEAIAEITKGHKGLVGNCCWMVQSWGIRSIARWQRISGYDLISHISKLRSYQSITRSTIGLTAEQQEMLSDVLLTGEARIRRPQRQRLAGKLLADGVLHIKNESPDFILLEATSPLLAAVVLAKARRELVSMPRAPAGPTFDPVWLLHRSIEYMHLDVILREEAANKTGKPAEYVYQAELYATARAILLGSGVFGYSCTPEARIVNERNRLDFLCKDGDQLPPYGYELVAHGTKAQFDEHLRRGRTYAEQHAVTTPTGSVLECTTFVVNFAFDDEKECTGYWGEKSYKNVIPIHVVLDQKLATAIVHSRDGKLVVKSVLKLLGNTGKLQFDPTDNDE